MRKTGWLTLLIASVIVLVFGPVVFADQASLEELKAKSKSLIAESEVMELRLYLHKGKIVWVEPIPQKELVKSQVKPSMRYTVDFVSDLKGENIREVSAVAFQQDSPGCSYWYVYETRDGIVKICLQP